MSVSRDITSFFLLNLITIIIYSADEMSAGKEKKPMMAAGKEIKPMMAAGKEMKSMMAANAGELKNTGLEMATLLE